MPLDPKTKALAQGANFAIVTTLMPDGTPQSQPLWVDADDDHLLLNTEIHRQRYKNVQRDPRVTVVIIEDGAWYSFVEVRGHLDGEVRGAEARAHIDSLAKKYMGVDDYPNPIQSERVILKIAPDRQNVR
jgi:PPOX class probable F420-dependent enzyme